MTECETQQVLDIVDTIKWQDLTLQQILTLEYCIEYVKLKKIENSK